MKKILIIAVLVMVMSVFVTGVAMAASVHGGYTSNTDACAGCHVAHAALGSKLLTRSNQTDFCYTCHGDNASGSSLNTQSGINENYVDLAGVPIGTPTTGGGFGVAFTSIHNLGNSNAIPGGGVGITGGLQCGSCHNPHGNANTRMLKTDVNGSTTALTVAMTFNTDGKNQIASYTSGTAAWCAACHNKFNKAAGSGSTLAIGETMYRHAMGVSLTTPLTTTQADVLTGTPLESNKVVCITCHRAHGTKAIATGNAATWHRDSDGTAITNTGAGSALLRMDNRGVCYNCHKDASINH